ncbi:SSS family solute:Na+ symporter [Prauserella sediminis]|uniref:SSS family solute:Na+ symporter n=1 Tax=Prauserella sediminis TaxID=577680 RepID=A0A839XP28_9PSEU|nr:sodium:solute symporter family protein [Prauserella sediminis]MBB3664501.1 SSS family solute:Na+ symporter [Prauserella sediminis]
MNTVLVVTIIGLIVIGLIGFLGSRGASRSASEWSVGGRSFPTWTMWFLQAGEIFTTFTFLGMVSLVLAGGVAAMYVPIYLVCIHLMLFFVGPRLWRISKAQGSVGQADFLTTRYGSRTLGWLSGLIGVVFLIPYLQLQVEGMGIMVQLATGDATSANLSMIVGVVILVAFVLRAGVRGQAATAYFKDFAVLVALTFLVIVIPLHFTDGIAGTFDQVLTTRPEAFVIGGTTFDLTWFMTSVAISAIGGGFITTPHTWQAVLPANSARAVRRNTAMLPLFTLMLTLPTILGFTALAIDQPGDPSAALLTMARDALPDWALGLVIIAGAATAMVPAAGMLIGMSTMVASTLVPTRTDRGMVRVRQCAVVLIGLLTLASALRGSDLLAELLLLTFSGLAQLAPANALAMLKRPVRAAAILPGLLIGVAIVAWLQFGGLDVGTWNVGIIALAINVTITALLCVLIPRRNPNVATTTDSEATRV